MMEKYTILTTVYSKEKPLFLEECLESMVRQTVLPDEYVIVEDGPLPEELEAIITKFASNYPFFKIVKLKENSGCGLASIAGVNACTNDLVARIDSDDISLPNRCEMELKEFEEDSDLVVVGSDMYEFEEDPNTITGIKIMPHTNEEIYKFGKKRNPMNHSTVMFRKSVVQQYGGYAPIRRSLDLELFTKLVFNGCKCKNIDVPLVKFRTGSARVKRKKNWTNLKCDLSVYKRNMKAGYINFTTYLSIVIRQYVFFLLPSRLASFLYKKMYR